MGRCGCASADVSPAWTRSYCGALFCTDVCVFWVHLWFWERIKEAEVASVLTALSNPGLL